MKSASRSNKNIKLTNESFFEDYKVASITDHDSIEELALHYDAEGITSYMTADQANEMVIDHFNNELKNEPQEGFDSYL